MKQLPSSSTSWLTLPLRVDGRPTRREVIQVSGWLARLRWRVRLLSAGLKKDGAGLWLTSCKAVMALPGVVDVVFLHPDGTVVKVIPQLKAWRSVACSRASSALALPAGAAQRLGLHPGVALDLQT